MGVRKVKTTAAARARATAGAPVPGGLVGWPDKGYFRGSTGAISSLGKVSNVRSHFLVVTAGEVPKDAAPLPIVHRTPPKEIQPQHWLAEHRATVGS